MNIFDKLQKQINEQHRAATADLLAIYQEAYKAGYRDGAHDGLNSPELAQAVLDEMDADEAQDAAEAHYDDEMWDFDPSEYTPDIEAWHADGK